MGDGELKVELGERAPGPRGRDEVSFLVKPNAGLPFAPVAQTASGGELSRIALALRVVSHAQSGEGTIVFDEIDAGVGGGQTGQAVADSLRRLGERAQVIAITHLPQIASVAGTHLVVTKVAGDPTQTEVSALDGEQQRAELERMLGGSEFLAAVSGQIS
jgi:DNA repair protein RecN (Recombination protein N)